MAIYNLSFINESDNFFEIMQGTSLHLDHGLYWGLVLFVSFLIIFVTFSKFDTKVVMVVDGMLTLLLSVLFWAGGLTTSYAIIAAGVLFGAIVIFQLSKD